MNNECKTEDDHSFEFIKDTEGDGRDASFFLCRICGEERDKDERRDARYNQARHNLNGEVR